MGGRQGIWLMSLLPAKREVLVENGLSYVLLMFLWHSFADCVKEPCGPKVGIHRMNWPVKSTTTYRMELSFLVRHPTQSTTTGKEPTCGAHRFWNQIVWV
jgi:hypothetical protein